MGKKARLLFCTILLVVVGIIFLIIMLLLARAIETVIICPGDICSKSPHMIPSPVEDPERIIQGDISPSASSSSISETKSDGVLKTTTHKTMHCLATVVKTSAYTEKLDCQPEIDKPDNNRNFLLVRDKWYTCKELMEDNISFSKKDCCAVRELCNREGYCEQGTAECFGESRPLCVVCEGGVAGNRCFEINTVYIECSCDTAGHVPSPSCEVARFNTSTTCWTIHALTPTQARCCVCNNKTYADMTIHSNTSKCSTDNIDTDTSSKVCQ